MEHVGVGWKSLEKVRKVWRRLEGFGGGRRMVEVEGGWRNLEDVREGCRSVEGVGGYLRTLLKPPQRFSVQNPQTWWGDGDPVISHCSRNVSELQQKVQQLH